jgi:hypothetical protein
VTGPVHAGSLAVIGCSDGSVRAHSTTTGKLMHRVRVEEGSPVTALRMRVSSAETQNVVMFATADGHVRYWHVTSGRFLGSPVSEVKHDCPALPPPALHGKNAMKAQLAPKSPEGIYTVTVVGCDASHTLAHGAQLRACPSHPCLSVRLMRSIEAELRRET